MKYSIIIPVYKVERYLKTCVDSVLSQSFTDYELILVDDGSPDLCPEICDEYATNHSSIKVIHQPNAGLACARNAGFELAEGEYIIFIDSDDYLSSPNALEEIAKVINYDTDVVVYGFKKYFESNNSYGSPICNFPSNAAELDAATFLMKLLEEDAYTGTAWAKVVRRSLLVENNIRFKPGMISEDIDWYLQVMLSTNRYACVNQPLYVYRMRPDSISHAVKEKSLIDNLWIKETWPERILNSSSPDALKQALMHIMARYMGNFMVLYASYNSDIRRKYRERVKRILPLFDYAITPRALTIKKCLNILGLKLTLNYSS